MLEIFTSQNQQLFFHFYTFQHNMQQLHLSLPFNHKYHLTCQKLNGIVHFHGHRTHHLQTSVLISNHKPTLSPLFTTNASNNLVPIKKIAPCNAIAFASSLPSDGDADADDDNDDVVVVDNPIKNEGSEEGKKGEKNFWGAVTLIIGAAVGPGMLGLPSLTIKSGPFPSTLIILLAWLYVISSIIIVAELCFDAMEQDGIEEVSFTSLATRTLGSKFGAFVALVYTSLCFSLLVACVAGIGSIFSPWFPMLKNNTLILHALFPLLVGVLIVFFPFNTIDVANRLLCFLMLFSITGLVAVGLSVARANIISSFFASASWELSSILPIIPVAVLTLGFHVITPFMCKIAGNTVHEARKAILIGGAIPLVMVLSWNLIVLGLVGSTNKGTNFGGDPISLLLSVNPSALSAVQGFAFSAMATSLIGYAVSLPKQILDTLELVFGKGAAASSRNLSIEGSHEMRSNDEETFDAVKVFVTLLVLGFSVLIASYFRSTFSRALDFAGVYANCFLFGIIPPVMAYIQQSKKKIRYG